MLDIPRLRWRVCHRASNGCSYCCRFILALDLLSLIHSLTRRVSIGTTCPCDSVSRIRSTRQRERGIFRASDRSGLSFVLTIDIDRLNWRERLYVLDIPRLRWRVFHRALNGCCYFCRFLLVLDLLSLIHSLTRRLGVYCSDNIADA